MSEQPEHPKQEPDHSGEPEPAAAPLGATEPEAAGSEAESPAAGTDAPVEPTEADTPSESTAAAEPAAAQPDSTPAAETTEASGDATPAAETAAPAEPAAPATETAAPAEPAAPAAETTETPADATPAAETAAPAEAGAPAAEGESKPAADRGQRQGRPGGPRRRPERRRRPSPAQRHRNAFYAKLSELRRQDEAEQQGRLDEPTSEDAEGAAAEAQQQEAAPAQPQQQQQGGRVPLPGRAQARVRAAVERVGGDESVREALAPKQRPDGQTMKWSAVCCDAAQGLSAGDPVFTAWARLAVTPVREIKSLVDPRDRDGRSGRGRGGPRRGGGGGGGGDRPWRGDRDRQGGGGAGAEDMRQHGRDGSFKSRIRIVDMSKGRDEDRPDKGEEAKREAAERLDRLGY